MRIFPILTAIVVVVVLYFAVFDRDALLQFAGNDPAPEAATTTETAEADAAPQSVTETTTDHVIKVVVATSSAQQIDSAVLVRGRTEAARQVDVRSETTSTVISEPLRKGATVAAGDMLCELDPGTRTSSLATARAGLPEAQARVASANAALNEAQINLNAAQKLSAEGFASDTRVANAEAAIEAAQAGVVSAEAGVEAAMSNIAAAEKEIERLTIHAPFGGLLESDSAELGSLLSAGGTCATIIQLDPIKLVGFVPETDVDKVKLGAMAGARLTSGREVIGQVTFVSRSADEATRTFRIEVSVDNADMSIGDGQTAEIGIAAEGRSAHLLAQSSLTLNDEGRIGIRTVDEANRVKFMPVQVIRDTMDGIWVAGLPETVEVIVVGQEFVTEGVLVEPHPQEMTQ